MKGLITDSQCEDRSFEANGSSFSKYPVLEKLIRLLSASLCDGHLSLSSRAHRLGFDNSSSVGKMLQTTMIDSDNFAKKPRSKS